MKWKIINEFPEYEISDTGLVRHGAKLLTPQLNSKGYLKISFSVKHKPHNRLIHRLVAIAFIPNPNSKPQVNHIDGNKLNNNVSNLEWVTNSENQKHSIANGLRKVPKGSEIKQHKLTEEDVIFIKQHAKKQDKEYSYVALGKRFNVHPQTIKNICDNKKWKHIKH